MKKALLILVWYVMVQSSDPFDKWIIVWESEDVTVKVKNTDFLEYQEIMDQSESRFKLKEDMEAYYEWETKGKFDNFRYN